MSAQAIVCAGFLSLRAIFLFRVSSLLRCYPAARSGGVEYSFNHGHVSDRVFKGYRNLSVFAHSLGERFSLHCVLIARREDLCGNTAASQIAIAVDEQTRGSVGESVEGDFQFNPAACAQKVYALIGDQ